MVCEKCQPWSCKKPTIIFQSLCLVLKCSRLCGVETITVCGMFWQYAELSVGKQGVDFKSEGFPKHAGERADRPCQIHTIRDSEKLNYNGSGYSDLRTNVMCYLHRWTCSSQVKMMLVFYSRKGRIFVLCYYNIYLCMFVNCLNRSVVWITQWIKLWLNSTIDERHLVKS